MPKEKLEQFSPEGEIGKLEKERISSGMFALYPELWGPIEKKRKEEIIEAVKSEISAALQYDDFGYIEKLSQELNRYLGQENAEKYGKMEKPYKAESKLGPERIISDLRTMAEESAAWKDAKGELDDRHDPSFRLVLASGMARLDPDRFKKEVKISDRLWQECLGFIMNRIGRRYPAQFALAAADLKALDPERFNRDVKINDNEWDMIAEAIKKEKGHSQIWVTSYDAACELNEEEIKKRVPITKGDWEDIRARVKSGIPPENKAMLASRAQRIKPEEMPDIMITRRDWEEAREELKDTLLGRAHCYFFACAGKMKNLKVE